MAKPVPSPDQIAAIEATVSDQTNMQNALTASAALQDPEIEKATKVDAAFQDLFDWYNDNIIGKYDAEQKALNGVYVTSPVVEADIIGVGANPPTGRLVPTAPVQDIVRIPEFDGGNTSTAANYEQKHIADQAQIETALVSGYGGVAPAATVLTNSIITPSSTTLQLKDLTTTFSIAVNSVFVIASGGDLAVVKILTFVMQVAPVPPPYIANCNIELIVPPTGSITTGAQLDVFTGFTNGERTTKTASDPDLQPLMDYFVDQIELHINARITRLAEQLAALSTNEDPDGTAQIATATTNVNTSNSFLTGYLVTTDISNTGLGTLSTERGVRSPQITSRLAEIVADYTGQTENYYDARYSTANNRGNTSRGTLRAKSNAEGVKSNSLSMAASLTASIASLNGILPP